MTAGMTAVEDCAAGWTPTDDENLTLETLRLVLHPTSGKWAKQGSRSSRSWRSNSRSANFSSKYPMLCVGCGGGIALEEEFWWNDKYYLAYHAPCVGKALERRAATLGTP